MRTCSPFAFCYLHLRIEGSELEARVQQLYAELTARGVALRPDCYLGDEWFSPEGVPAIAIPFSLAHPRLKSLELRQMMEVEGGTPEWCMMLLRHECGHAMDHAWQFSRRTEWQQVFGGPESTYAPETYTPRAYSRGFVQHLPNWYAQAHPDEDFAETFAVWLSTPHRRYAIYCRRFRLRAARFQWGGRPRPRSDPPVGPAQALSESEALSGARD